MLGRVETVSGRNGRAWLAGVPDPQNLQRFTYLQMIEDVYVNSEVAYPNPWVF